MKIKYLLVGILLCFSGCALFKKTNKTTAINEMSAVKQMEANEFLLKQANKETQILTYWNDSAFYQIQNIKEQVDQAKSKQAKVKETENSKGKLVTKESEPLKIWFWIGFVIVALVSYAVIYAMTRFFSGKSK